MRNVGDRAQTCNHDQDKKFQMISWDGVRLDPVEMPTLEILAIFLLSIANGVFAMAEIAVVSSRRARLEGRAQEGSRNAQIAIDLANNPNDFLSTVQIGITMIGTLAGAFGGAKIAGYLSGYLNSITWIAPRGETVALVLVVIVISYLSLVIGELVPKRLALANPERYAVALSPLMKLLSKVAAPAVRFLSWSSDLLIRVIPMRRTEAQTVTEEEVRHIIGQATEAGALEQAEQVMVEGVFRLGDRRVAELMTPRQEIAWIDLEDSPEQIRLVLRDHNYSRFPVALGDLDHVKGFVHVKDLLDKALEEKPFDVLAVLRQAPVVPESMRALRALEALQGASIHLAFVVNEHGGIEGIVTVTDILQAVVGPPASEREEEALMVPRDDGSWLVDGLTPAYQLKEALKIRKLPREQDGTYTTAGGFVMTSLGRVPASGDRFDQDGWSYEVVDMDGNRVDKILVSPIATPEQEESL
jgi:putative hemolysin